MNSPSAEYSIRKVLSANDLGLTGSHQAGILIPKQSRILSFFPHLSDLDENPSREVSVLHAETGTRWILRFVYYNSKPREVGTRNEYRLTRMMALLGAMDARVGDALVFKRSSIGEVNVSIDRHTESSSEISSRKVVLRGGWTLIDD